MLGCFSSRRSIRFYRDGLRAIAAAGLLGVLLALPSTAHAQADSCNGLISLVYLSGPAFAVTGDTYRVRVRLGTDEIEGGTQLTVDNFRFELSCQTSAAIGCAEDDDTVRYVSDSTITFTGCNDSSSTPITGWSSDGADSEAASNTVTFTPSSPVVIPANTPTSAGCEIQFDVRVEDTPGTDASPLIVQQAVGYDTGDAECNTDPTLPSTASQTGQIRLCPACADGECFNEVCSQTTGLCERTNEPVSTPCGDTDANDCTTAGCDGAGTCVQTHVEVVCEDPECQECNPQTGECADKADQPPTCGPVLGCRVTTGGVAPNTPDQPPGGDAIGETSKATFGGQVGAPCGCIGCFDDLDSVQGSWTHSRKKQVGRFHASDFSSLVCDLDDGEGPLPRPAPANKVCFAGVGLLADNGGKRETEVAFRVDAEDRGEPGAGKNSGAQPDVYRMRIWIPGAGQAAEDFLDGICCLNDEPVGVGLPSIDDGADFTHGNLQIHPVLPNTERGICPPPEEVLECFQQALP